MPTSPWPPIADSLEVATVVAHLDAEMVGPGID
jgi:hypothetical protein